MGGGSDREPQLTLSSPVLVLVERPVPSGSDGGCYLAATVSVHAQTWRSALRTAPGVEILPYWAHHGA